MKNAVKPLIKKEISNTNWLLISWFLIIFTIQTAVFYFILGMIIGSDWLSSVLISSLGLVTAAIISFYVTDRLGNNIGRKVTKSVNAELSALRAANNRATSLQAMASTLRATLSFDQVVEQALDVCSIALEEMGMPTNSLVGAVFLFEGSRLTPVATRRFLPADYDKVIRGKSGIVGKALAQAETTVTTIPHQDPELRTFLAFNNCRTVVCVPLRAGFQIFGAMVVGSDAAVEFDNEHLELFNSVADQAVIALQNAQLYQTLEKEKQRIIHADEEARKELARDLHDGPTQSIAAIAMRLNFIRTLISRDPEQALVELEKVEDLAKDTSKEIRGMLFTLRPLVLETQGLVRAIETVMKKLRDSDGLNVRLIGEEYGDLLSDQAQSVVFSIVEEALGNAKKYAKAKLIEIRMWQEEDLFVIRVQDDGVGFDAQAVNRDYSTRGSLGMVNMRERAERIDGSLRLESAPGKGTAITLVVPLDKHGREVTLNT